MLHAGVLKKFGLYGLIQVALPLVPGGAMHWAHPLAWLAVIATSSSSVSSRSRNAT